MNKKEILNLEKVNGIKEKARNTAKNFNKEFKKEMRTAIMAAFGFLIALVWKDVITGIVNNVTEDARVGGVLISALVVTFISVLGIMLVSKLLKENDDGKK